MVQKTLLNRKKIASVLVTIANFQEHFNAPIPKFISVTCFVFIISCLTSLMTIASEPNSKIIPAKVYKPLKVSNTSKSGEILFIKHNCVTCHSVGSHGGCLGPPLMGEGSRRSRDFILSRITQGSEARFQQVYKANELMPHPRVSEKTAEAITAYLLTLEEPRSGFIISKHPVVHSDNIVVHSAQTQSPAQNSIATGKKLFFEKGCAECHTAGGVGGQFAPDLDGIASIRDRSYIEKTINNAQTMTLRSADEYNERGTMMPSLNLTASEVSKITDFLMTLPTKK